ncbi:MAG TPA: hypothetical protein VHW09_21750 [Bryobacteraceae bacterium]|nr:hypothetical protein [Bryobacteraceae bacterium]
MKKFGKTWQYLGCGAAIMLSAAIAQAGTIVVTTTPFSGNDSVSWGTQDYLDPGASPTRSSFAFASGANTVTVSFSNPANPMQGDGIVGVAGGSGAFGWTIGAIFTSGTSLLGTNNNTSSNPNNVVGDTMTLTFATPVSEFGTYIQNFDQTDPFTVTISANGSPVSPSESSGANGNAFFIGVMDQSGTASINSITLTTTQSVTGGTPDYFVIGTSQFNNGNGTVTSTPEPASVLFMAGGVALIGWKARKRARA